MTVNIQCEFKIISCGLEYKVGQLRLEAYQGSGEEKKNVNLVVELFHLTLLTIIDYFTYTASRQRIRCKCPTSKWLLLKKITAKQCS